MRDPPNIAGGRPGTDDRLRAYIGHCKRAATLPKPAQPPTKLPAARRQNGLQQCLTYDATRDE
jgi:hypothetical protein